MLVHHGIAFSEFNHQTDLLNLTLHLPHSVPGYLSSLPTCFISSIQVSVRQRVLPVQYSADQLPSAEKTHSDETEQIAHDRNLRGCHAQDALLLFLKLFYVHESDRAFHHVFKTAVELRKQRINVDII